VRWPLVTVPPVFALAIAVVEPSLGALLMTVVGASALLMPGLCRLCHISPGPRESKAVIALDVETPGSRKNCT